MKDGIHPEYKDVIFFDASVDFKFLTRSTMTARGGETMKWTDGKEYPVVRLDVSSESHPFYTGKQKVLDTAGRVEKFRQKYGMYTSNKG
ncbi:large subunit ribosomal protein L31 [Silvimonas terrae]|uniref:Large ribosomal subunit protein bL31B n=1 Tax=Silvimonas terrae TaxID=300266 RepID=A0A840RM74_9NEIS|nr:type B 50S ribosomal protein L31 [Silvimonas terrae]MBB5193628.1 large subunit ribosomal protein L31 [Silvimonas terrae]